MADRLPASERLMDRRRPAVVVDIDVAAVARARTAALWDQWIHSHVEPGAAL